MSERRRPKGDGDCYPVAATLVVGTTEDAGAFTLPEALDARLIHATVTGQGPIAGVRYGHAWVEITVSGLRWAVDRSNGRDIMLPAALYRHVGNAENVHEYTVAEARTWMVESGHYGPWEGEWA